MKKNAVGKMQHSFLRAALLPKEQVTNSSPALHIEKAGKRAEFFKSIEIKSIRDEERL